MSKKTTVYRGERITRGARLRTGCSAVIFDPSRTRVLLTRRADNGEWCMPGGALEPGEALAEACEREVFEETGLWVRVVRLVGVYSNRDLLVEYPDGNRAQIIAIHFEAQITGGSICLSNETTDIGYFAFNEVEQMQLLGNHKERIADAMANQSAAFFR